MKPEYIIVHCSATKDSGTVSWQAIRKYHKGTLGWSAIGYHFGVELVGKSFEVIAGRPLDRMGAHCKAAGMNSRSLGFCFIGDFDTTAPAPEMLEKGARHIKGLCATLGIPIENVKAHRDYEPKKTCPGKCFDMENLRQLIREA